ncbi:hypothetical protein EIQ03_10275 [Xanthomonas campestris pv. raphani]|nr:hypothetical protein D0A38_10550 [Xanthomonas campestris pv. incanae]TXD45586.1 hypothetical protein TR80_001385 [Xanthomonas campestris]
MQSFNGVAQMMPDHTPRENEPDSQHGELEGQQDRKQDETAKQRPGQTDQQIRDTESRRPKPSDEQGT